MVLSAISISVPPRRLMRNQMDPGVKIRQIRPSLFCGRKFLPALGQAPFRRPDGCQELHTHRLTVAQIASQGRVQRAIALRTAPIRTILVIVPSAAAGCQPLQAQAIATLGSSNFRPLGSASPGGVMSFLRAQVGSPHQVKAVPSGRGACRRTLRNSAAGRGPLIRRRTGAATGKRSRAW